MGIIIQNVSKKYTKKGPQDYILRINDKVIAQFTHNYEDGLAECLRKAALAAEEPNRQEVLNEKEFIRICMEASLLKKTSKKKTKKKRKK